MIVLRLGLITVVASVVLAGPASATLLVNPSFEGISGSYQLLGGGSTAIDGWTTSGEGVEWFTSGTFGAAFDGDALIDLAWFTSNGTPGGGIFQTVATTPGQSYDLNFAMVTHQTAGRNGTAIINLLIDDSAFQSYSITNLNSVWTTDDWVEATATFVATGTTTKIAFSNTQNANLHFAYLDGIGLNPTLVQGGNEVPEPASWAMLIVGFGIVGAAARRKRQVLAV